MTAQIEKLQQRLALVNLNIIAGFAPNRDEARKLQERRRILRNQIRMATAVQQHKINH